MVSRRKPASVYRRLRPAIVCRQLGKRSHELTSTRTFSGDGSPCMDAITIERSAPRLFRSLVGTLHDSVRLATMPNHRRTLHCPTGERRLIRNVKMAETTMTQATNSRVAWFNGKFMPENQVLIPFRDRSWRYGNGVFDMTRTFNGCPFRLKEHIDRLYCSLRYLRLDPGMSPQEMIDVSEQVVVRNEHLRGAAVDWWIGQRISRGVDPIDDE